MSMALMALGVNPKECGTDLVNEVMGARPMKGAAWEQALACAQHYGVRGTLVCPSTVPQLKSWTEAGKPVMISWNPEGREWSHASVVFDVTDELPSPVPPECTITGESGPWVWVADSNIPNPEKTVRIVCADVFYSKWFEKWPNYLVRRPAMMLDREITPEGRQVMASARTASWESERRQDKRQELRSELWEEDNPGLAAYRENQRKEKELRETQTSFIQNYFYRYALRGWATEQTDPEILSWVTKILAGKLRPWPSSLTNRLGKYMSPEAKKDITDFLESYPRGWGSDWEYSVAWWKGETHSPQKLFEALKKNIPARLVKYESLAKGWKPYVLPPNVSLPSTPAVKTVVDAESAEKIQILTDLSGKIQDPTIGQVLEAYKTGAKPTDDQLKKIRNLLYRSRMAPEADKFRVASMEKNAEPSDCWKDGLRGRELAECYMRFENDLGREDIALVKKYFPNWSPSGRGNSPKRPVQTPILKTTVPADYPARAKKLYAVLYAVADGTSRFVRDNLYQSELSDKQIKWFEDLEKKHAGLLRKMPDDVHLLFANNAPFITVSSDADKDKFEKVLKLTPRRGREYYISGLAESTPDPVVDSSMRAGADHSKVASVHQVVAMHLVKSTSQVVTPKDKNREVHQDPTKNRDRGAIGLIERGGAGAGKHKNKQDFDRGHARTPKHKGRGDEESMGGVIKASSVEGEIEKVSPPVKAKPSPELVARAHVAAQSPGYAITNPLRFGLMPLTFMYGRILEQPRQMVVLSGESLRVIKTKKIVVLVGVDERGQPILARNEAELKAKTEALNQSRLHHESV
jgi:hypothetical protein